MPQELQNFAFTGNTTLQEEQCIVSSESLRSMFNEDAPIDFSLHLSM